MYFTSGSDRAFEQLMQERPGADHFDNGEAGAPEDCGTCRFYRPHWKYQFCVYEECPYQPGKLTALDGAVKFQVKGVDDEMAVFRVEKNRGYTVMSNHHLRNKDLSLKAKGLLSQMLSLPEDWDFTLKGLSLINREQIDAIRAAVRELEQAGYIVRSRERDGQGRLRGADYLIYEQPQPAPDSPTLENPMLEKPTQEKPTQGNPTQLNKDISNTEKSTTDGLNTESIPILSPPSPLADGAAGPPKRNGKEAATQSAIEIYREIIMDNIEYFHLVQNTRTDRELLDEIVDLLVETVCSARKTIRIAGDDYPAELVKAKLMKLDSSHIEFVIDCLRKNTTEIRNIKKYLLASLFNAPSTINGYYTALVAHDMNTGKI
ncbi:MAG TPA: helix-turn-helix domain-containing protein [Candidatus Blautia intestinavium]|nr:helix-turn-helix domain-containing protein [Candidatus Blautia intestinavium]